MYLPGIPAHVIQRGNNREPCFFAECDYRFYLHRLGRALNRYCVQLHAYVLMTNHVHLLLTPADSTGISRVMSLLGQRYAQYINAKYRRSGSIWEGRYKASLINADEHLLSCYRYIELNPVRAGMVETPDRYPWSSYRYHAWGEANQLIQDHPLFIDLGRSAIKRQSAYQKLFQVELPNMTIHSIRQAAHANYPLGNERFKDNIEKTVQRQVGYAKRGRPGNATTG
jgi:putative transposase